MLDMISGIKQAVTNGKNAVCDSSQKELKWILVDALVVAFIALFAIAPQTIPDMAQCWTMIKAFLAAFFVEVAVERGIKQKEPKNNNSKTGT